MPSKGRPKSADGWMRNRIAWSPEVERQIAVLGAYIERVNKKLENEFTVLTSVRNKDGSWVVSLIVEAAVVQTARQVAQVKDWERYKAAYLSMSDTAESRELFVSESANNAIEAIEDYLQQIGFNYAKAGKGKRNKRLIIAMCLSYMVEKVSG